MQKKLTCKTLLPGFSYEITDTHTSRILIRPAEDLKPYYLRAESDSPSPEASPEEPNNPTIPDDLPSPAFFDEDFEINFFPPSAAEIGSPSDHESSHTLESVNLDPESTHDFPQIEPENELSANQILDPYEQNDETSSLTLSSSSNEIAHLEESFYESASEAQSETEISAEREQQSPDKRTKSPTSGFILSKESNSGRISPPDDQEFELKLYQMRTSEVHDLAELFKIDITGTVLMKKQQINDFFQKHYPEHPRTDKGHLLFRVTFNPCENNKLSEMSAIELEAIIKSANSSMIATI